MTQKEKDNLLKIILIYVCTFGTITLVIGLLKVINLFYKQVIL
jgi:hypothetical protein